MNTLCSFIQTLVLLIFIVGGAPAVFADDAGTLAVELANPGYHEKPAWFKNSFLDIREDIDEATTESKRLMLYFYQDGCPYCAKLLNDNFGQKDIADKTQGYFHTIAVNMWGDREVVNLSGDDTTEKQFAKSFKVQFTPTLILLDESGKVLVRINGYYAPHKFDAVLDYVGQKMESQLSIRDHLAQQIFAAASGKLHHETSYLQPPYQLREQQQKSQRPLLVMFEQKQCRACDELHTDVLQRPMSQALLKSYDIALLDMWSKELVQTPGGRKLPAREWATELGIQFAPSMVFFDLEGNEAFRTEGYLKSFHVQSSFDYVASGAYRDEPEFQRYISTRADTLEAQGIHVDIMD